VPARPLTIRRTPGQRLVLQEVCLPGDRPLDLVDDDFLWVAYDGSKQVGFVLFRDHGGLVFLERAGVLPAYGGRGLYQRLLRAAERGLPKGARLVTYTARDNLASANGLIAAGWRLYEPQARWGWADGLYLTKVLS
jgi:ribosomal protein S18 acetylase RimI-like enzyme